MAEKVLVDREDLEVALAFVRRYVPYAEQGRRGGKSALADVIVRMDDAASGVTAGADLVPRLDMSEADLESAMETIRGSEDEHGYPDLTVIRETIAEAFGAGVDAYANARHPEPAGVDQP